jgi:nitrate/nitrite transporter NarK
VLIPLLADHLGWRTGYGLTLVPLLAMLALTYLLVRPGPLAVAAAAGHPGTGNSHPLARVLRARFLWPLNIAAFLSYGAFIGMLTWLPVLLVDATGLSRPIAGTVTALVTAGTMVSWPLAGLVSDRLGLRKAVWVVSLALGAVACAVFAVLAPAGAGIEAFAITAALAGLLLGGMVTPYVMLTDALGPSLVGSAAGVVNTFWLLGGLAIPVIVGKVVDLTGSLPAAFIGCAAVEVLAVASAALSRETGRRRRGRTGESA